MRASVVIPTLNRAKSLHDTLDGLRRQTFAHFEVIVVNGPSTDGTRELLAGLEDVRVVENRERNLSRSRNLGVAAAAGDVVAFIDDDAIPESRWLEQLVAPLELDPRLAATGGLVLDNSGVRVQWRHLVSSRAGEQDFDQVPPLERFVAPGADPFLYVAGGCSAFRRAALVEIGGFDEEIEYNFDETEACLRLLDAGWRLESLDAAVVHHRFLPSHQRSSVAFTDPFYEVKNRVYFGLANGTRGRASWEVLASVNLFLSRLKAGARDAAAHGRLDPVDLAHYLGRADAGFHSGLQRGLRARRRGVAVPAPDPSAFVAYRSAGTGERAVLVADLPGARARADAGDEVHLLLPEPAGTPYRVDYDAGVWVRHVPVNPRWLPGVSHRGAAELEAALAGARADVEGTADRRRFPVDWEYEARMVLAEHEPDALVEAAYRRLLGRAPDAIGREIARADLLHRGTPQELVRRMARSAEGRGRGIDPDLHLPSVPAAEARGRLRAAWLRDDAAFAREVCALLLGDEARAAPVDVGDRGAFVRALAARPQALDRVAGADRLPPDGVRTAPELRAELDRLAGAADAAFVDGLYRLLLGRDADPDGAAAYVGGLRAGRARASVVQEIASSHEAAGYGSAPDVVAAHLRASAAFRPRLVQRARSVLRRARD